MGGTPFKKPILEANSVASGTDRWSTHHAG
jgi:hypothetical protein